MILQHARDMRKIKKEADRDTDLSLEERAEVTRQIAFNTTAFASEAGKIEKDKTEVTVNTYIAEQSSEDRPPLVEITENIF